MVSLHHQVTSTNDQPGSTLLANGLHFVLVHGMLHINFVYILAVG